jgi:hypothetical protein
MLYGVRLCTCTTAAVANSGSPLKHTRLALVGLLPTSGCALDHYWHKEDFVHRPFDLLHFHPCRLHHIEIAHEG